MNQRLYNQMLIDVAEIWNSELERYSMENSNQKWHEELHDYLKAFYLQNQHKPFISREMVNEDDSLKGYYKNYYDRLEQYKNNGQLDFFEYKGGFYDMNEPCIIEKDEVSSEVYKKLFSIKLKQLEDNQELLVNFINFHYYKTFQKDLGQYTSFLSSLQLQNDILSPKLVQIIDLWKLTASHLLDERLFREVEEDKISWYASNELLEDPNRGVLDTIEVATLDNYKEQDLEENETKQVIESQPIVIEGKLNLDEIRHYFSFLYLDKGSPDGYFLNKEDVDAIFKQGIVIPSKPHTNKFKLNYTPRYPKKLVDFFIYRFIQHYNVKAKREILIFFGNYIQDYESALDQRGLENLNKNITGKKPRNLFFNENDLLPKCFQ